MLVRNETLKFHLSQADEGQFITMRELLSQLSNLSPSLCWATNIQNISFAIFLQWSFYPYQHSINHICLTTTLANVLQCLPLHYFLKVSKGFVDFSLEATTLLHSTITDLNQWQQALIKLHEKMNYGHGFS